jgi:hypothetical protein
VRRYLFAITALLLLTMSQSHGLDYDLYVNGQAQWTQANVKANEDNNPNNKIFNLSEESVEVELRPRLEARWDTFKFNADPRLTYRSQRNQNDLDRRNSQLDLRYWQAEWNGDQLSLEASRKVQLWGPSVFFSPSSRYHIGNGGANPSSELLAREYFEARVFVNQQWDIELIANVGNGQQAIANFHRSGDLRLNWVGDSVSTSLQASWLNPGWGFGGLLQWTANDALIVYADGLYAPFTKIENQFELTPTSRADRTVRAVGGLSYTFVGGLNVAVDYYYNGSGLSNRQSDTLLQQSIDAVTAFLQNNTDRHTLLTSIRDINTVPTYSLSKGYGVVRIGQSQVLNDLSWNYLLIRNLDDQGQQHIVNIDYDFSDRLSLFVNGIVFSGDSFTEFGRFFSTRVTLGLRWVIL